MAKAYEKAVRFRFNHHCFLQGAEGVSGEVRELPADVAARLVERGGGEILPAEVPEAEAPSKSGE